MYNLSPTPKTYTNDIIYINIIYSHKNKIKKNI